MENAENEMLKQGILLREPVVELTTKEKVQGRQETIRKLEET